MDFTRYKLFFFSLLIGIFLYCPVLFGRSGVRFFPQVQVNPPPSFIMLGADSPFLVWGGGDGDWNTADPVWKNHQGVSVPFSPNSPVCFNIPLDSHETVRLVGEMPVGDIADMSEGNLTLSGDGTGIDDPDGNLSKNKITGSGTFIKGGGGTLTLQEGFSLGSRQILVTNGVLQLGANLMSDALGGVNLKDGTPVAPDIPLVIRDAGLLSINDGQNYAWNHSRARITFNKEIHLSGRGFQGNGLLINQSPHFTYFDFSNVRLLGDATVNSRGRMEIRKTTFNDSPKSGQASLTGPDAVLTLVNPDPLPGFGDAYLNLVDAEVDLKGIVLERGGGIGLEETTQVNLPSGITLGEGGMLRFTKFRSPVSFDISLKPSVTASIGTIRGKTEFNTPVLVGSNAVLQLVAGEVQEFGGGIFGEGKVEALDGLHYLCSTVTVSQISAAGNGRFRLLGGTSVETSAMDVRWNGGISIEKDAQVSTSSINIRDGGVHRFGLNGGTLNLVLAPITAVNRKVPQFVFNGGSLVLDTVNGSYPFDASLFGRGNLLLKGMGNFTTWGEEPWNRMSWGLSEGHWRIENRGTNDLRNVVSFVGGLSLAPDTYTRIRIQDPDRYVGMEFSPNARAFQSGGHGICGRMHDVLTQRHGEEYMDFIFSGSLEVLTPGLYTFATSYDDRLTLWIDGESVVSNPGWDQVGSGSIELTNGVYSFRISAYNDRDKGGPVFDDWMSRGVVLGYRIGSEGDNSPANLIPFDTDSEDFRMRPSTSLLLRRVPDKSMDWLWLDRQEAAFSQIITGIQNLHNTGWKEAKNVINEFEGWFRVTPDQEGRWAFWGRYDDRIALYIDGEKILHVDWPNDTRGEVSQMKSGFHHFRIRIFDKGGNVANEGKPTLKFAVNPPSKDPAVEEMLSFDENNLRITATPYGIINGTLFLDAGSVLENDAGSACKVLGTLQGTGTLKGKFRLAGATWEVPMLSGVRDAQGIRFVDPAPDTLSEIGKILFRFDKKPERESYSICGAYGLTAEDPDRLAHLAEVYVAGDETPCEGIGLAVENGMLVLRNLRPGRTLLELR